MHEHIQDLCRRLAKLGYLAIAPELYFRQGDPRKYPDIEKLLSEVVAKVPDAQVMTDLDATAAWASSNGGDSKKTGGDRLLLGWPGNVVVRCAQPEHSGRGRLVWPDRATQVADQTGQSDRYRGQS